MSLNGAHVNMTTTKDADTDNKNDSTCASVIVQAISTVLGVSMGEIDYSGATTSFVKLGGDSLSAIIISAECQKRGITVPAGAFLRIATLKEVVTTAANMAQALSASPLPALQTPSCSLCPPFPEPVGTAGTGISRYAEASRDESSLVHITTTTTDSETGDKPLFTGGQVMISAKYLLDRVQTVEWTEAQLLLLRETSHDQKLNMLTIYESYTGCWDAQYVCNAWTRTILAEPIFNELLCDLDASPEQLFLRRVIQLDADGNFQGELHDAVNASGPISKLTSIQSPSPTPSTPPWQAQSQSKDTEKTTTVVWRIHHAFMDGYSARILRNKISCALRGEIGVAPGPSFKDTVRLLRIFRESCRESATRFWDRKRKEFPTAVGELRLSPQKIAKATEIPSQRCVTIHFAGEQLIAASSRTGYTTTVYFAAAWALTLSKFMDTDQICFGMVFSGRDIPIPGAFDVVGPMVNVLPLFLSVPVKGDHETSVDTFLRYVHDAILELNDVQHSNPTEGFGRQFNTIMATQFECDEAEESSPLDRHRPDMQSAIPLSIVIEKQCRLQLFYSRSHFLEEDMSNVRSLYQNSMDCLLQDGDEKRLASSINDAPLPQGLEEKIRGWSNCASFESLDQSKEDDLVTLFENVVARQPKDVAIIHGASEKVSYDEFDRAAAAVARELSWLEPNEAVCIYADRSVNWLIAIFGVLKAGGVYAPIDPSAPESVQHANCSLSGARALLAPSRSAFTASWSTSSPRKKQGNAAPYQCQVLAIDDLITADGIQVRHDSTTCYLRRRIARPDDLAYICFTSGSTGQPKAVQCTHKGLVAFQKDPVVRLAASKGVVVAQVMSPLFDGSIHEIFSALTHGATLRLGSLNKQEDPFTHLQDSDSAILTPSIAKALNPDRYPRLKNVYLVGETVPQSLCEVWARNRSVYNMYGPTEATCGATIKRLLPNEPATLGRANPSSRVYILDRSHRLLPPGAVGELYLAGIQVSQGYIDLPQLSADCFLGDSVTPSAGQKMYKTGDHAYWDSVTGEICSVGRKDRQIKLRGFRLDLDDLEARIIKAIPGCRGAAVFRRDDYLIAAFQVPHAPVEPGSEIDVRALVADVLPPYAMPRRLVALAELPLTLVGKLDYKALEKVVSASIGNAATELQPQKGPMSTTEMMVLCAVRDLMGLEPSMTIDKDSNLVAIGGHSLLQLQLASRISSLIQRKFPVRKVIENPIISNLASAIDRAAREERGMDVAKLASSFVRPGQNALGANGISPIELDWFAKYRQNLGTSSFNVSHVSEFDSRFDQHQALISAWNMVLATHAILRCRFRLSTKDGTVIRSYATEPPKALYLDSFDVRAAINAEFSLGTEDPIRVRVSTRHMLVCVSHIICDYTTLGRLFEEVAAAYLNVEDAGKTPVARRQRRYQDTTCWNLDVDQATADFWKTYLSGINFAGFTPYGRAPRDSYRGGSLLFRLSRGTLSNLEIVSRSLHITPHQIALAITSLVLQVDSAAKQDLLLGSPHLGRQEEDMSTIGLFLQPLPIRIRRYSDQQQDRFKEEPLATFLQAVQESAGSALSHAIEWHSLMKVLSASDDPLLSAAATTPIPNQPLFDAMVTFHELGVPGQHSPSPVSINIPGVEPLVCWAEGAKFGIMFEFSAVGSSSVTLRVEYNMSLYSSEEVRLLAARVNVGLEYLNQSTSSRLGDLERRLLEVGGAAHAGMAEPTIGGEAYGMQDVEFGTPLTALL